MPRILLEDQGALGLSPREVIMLVQLDSYRWGPRAVVRPSHRQLARRMGMTVVSKILADLRRAGLIEVVADRWDRDDRRQGPNVITLDGIHSLVLVAENRRAGRDPSHGVQAAREALARKAALAQPTELPPPGRTAA